MPPHASQRPTLGQRNTEIAILVNMLNKPGSSGVDALSIRAAAEAAAASCPPMRAQAAASTTALAVGQAAVAGAGGGELLDTELLKDRNKAFEHFRCFTCCSRSRKL